MPSRGEIYWLRLEPTVGAEIQKTRPAVVISVPEFETLPLRIAVPFTTWREAFRNHRAKVFVAATAANGLPADSAADCMQVRSVALERFGRKMGDVAPAVLDEIVAGIAVVIDAFPGRPSPG